jgi:hypothetical protein
MAGSHNNINMLMCSPVFAILVEGYAPPCNMRSIAINVPKGTIWLMASIQNSRYFLKQLVII